MSTLIRLGMLGRLGGARSNVWTPANITTNLWADIAGYTAGNLPDRSGNNRTLVQAIGVQQPVLTAGMLNGLPGLAFDGVDDFLSATFTQNQPFSVYLTFRQKTWTANDRVFDGKIVDATLYQKTATPQLNMFFGSASPQITTVAVNTFVIVKCIFNGASSSFTLNNGTPINFTLGAGNPGGFTLANRWSGANYGNIDVVDLVHTPILSAADDANLWAYLGKRAGIAV